MLLLGVLQAQAAGAGPVGGAAFDLLEQRVLDSSESSVTFSSLSSYAADYQHLQIRFTARSSFAAAGESLRIRFNGVTSGSYSWHRLFGNGSSVSSGQSSSQTGILGAFMTSNTGTADAFGAGVIDILDPFSTSKNTTTRSLNGTIVSDSLVSLTSGGFYNTAAIDSISFTSETSANFLTGSRFSLYGIKAA